MAANDPRPSLEERYPTDDSYVGKVSAAAKKFVADRFLLPDDLLVSQAKAAAILEKSLRQAGRNRPST